MDVSVSHMIHDYECRITRLRRAITDDVELLELGLHALRHGSPHVTEEYLERVITALVDARAADDAAR
jgi:hypothetical protein